MRGQKRSRRPGIGSGRRGPIEEGQEQACHLFGCPSDTKVLFAGNLFDREITNLGAEQVDEAAEVVIGRCAFAYEEERRDRQRAEGLRLGVPLSEHGLLPDQERSTRDHRRPRRRRFQSLESVGSDSDGLEKKSLGGGLKVARAQQPFRIVDIGFRQRRERWLVSASARKFCVSSAAPSAQTAPDECPKSSTSSPTSAATAATSSNSRRGS
jgi:hypothetical protein